MRAPLIIILDDLQRADSASIELLKALFQDGKLLNILVIGCYRSNEVTPQHELARMIRDLEGTQSISQKKQLKEQDHPEGKDIEDLASSSTVLVFNNESKENNSNNIIQSPPILRITKIKLGNLNLRSVVSLVSAVLGEVDDSVGESKDDRIGDKEDGDSNPIHELAKVCYDRTLGNALFLLQFLRMLYEEDYIQYSLALMKWKYDAQVIRHQTSATTNVVELIRHTMIRKAEEVSSVVAEGEAVKEQEEFAEELGVSSDQVHHLLQLAACLGDNFEKKTLALLWTKIASSRKNSESYSPSNESSTVSRGFQILFELCLQHRFLELIILDVMYNDKEKSNSNNNNAKVYRWVHDKVREAATQLAETSRHFEDLQMKVGKVLIEEWNDDKVADNIFVVCNLLNHYVPAGIGEVNSSIDKNELTTRDNLSDPLVFNIAKLNLQAAKQARSLSAFSSSAKYAKRGIDILPVNSWKFASEMTFSLYMVCAEVEHKLGNAEMAEQCCRIIIQQDKRKKQLENGNPANGMSPLDRGRAYTKLAEVQSLFHRRHVDAMNVCLEALEGLDCNFPRNKIWRMVQGFRKLRKLRFFLDDGDSNKKGGLNKNDRLTRFSHLPPMIDEKRIVAMEIMAFAGRLAHYAFELTPYGFLMSDRMLDWTICYGIADESPQVIANIGTMIIVVFGDFERGAKYSELALSMVDRTPTKKGRSAVILFSYVMGLAFQKPVITFLEPLFRGYKAGMETGENLMAMFNICNYIAIELFCGKDLSMVEQDFQIYVPQMMALNQQEAYEATNIFWDAAKNLIGQTNETSKLQSVEDAVAGNDLDLKKRVHLVPQMFAYVYFGAYELGAKYALECGEAPLKAIMMNGLLVTFGYFYQGICLYAAANTQQQPASKRTKALKRYRKQAMLIRKRIQSFVQRGNTNSVHHLKLLNAENYRLYGKFDLAKQSYEDSILTSARSGFLHDAALCNERYADLLFSTLSEPDEAKFRSEEAIRYYTEWGAVKRAGMLRSAKK